MGITENASRLLAELPPGVLLLAAAKGKNPQEVMEAIEAGVRLIGENYVQEAEQSYPAISNKVEWHFIGHLQKNKVRKAVRIFDVIETVDSTGLAREIDKRCAEIRKIMPIFIEVNSGRESSKSGVYPEQTIGLIKEISVLQNVRITGLMTMGPVEGNPERCRPFYHETKILFDSIKRMEIPHVEMKYLSMGMSESYRVAIEEGANIVRIGTGIFGPR